MGQTPEDETGQTLPFTERRESQELSLVMSQSLSTSQHPFQVTGSVIPGGAAFEPALPAAAAVATAAASSTQFSRQLEGNQSHGSLSLLSQSVSSAVQAVPLSCRAFVPQNKTLVTMVESQFIPPGQQLSLPLHMEYSAPVKGYCGLSGSQGVLGAFGASSVPNTPLFFANRKLRSGKWTPEEEEYADLLIELFEKGHIDEKNGCTLRSFLSRKLHCAPMRISKKYAGKGIGKMVFLSKIHIPGYEGISFSAFAANMARLQDAEVKFYKSIASEFVSLLDLNRAPCCLQHLLYLLFFSRINFSRFISQLGMQGRGYIPLPM